MICLSTERFCVPAHQDEAGVIPVPPAERRHADFWVLVVMENLTSAVGVSAQDEPRLKPLQQLRREKEKRPKSTLEAASLHHRFHHLNANTAEDSRAGRPPSTTRRTSL